MKLMVGYGAKDKGFALPTILLVSMVMLGILSASIGATAASRVSLDSQYYNHLAEQAAQSGVARANECLKKSGLTPQWSTLAHNRTLRPNSDCTGTTMVGGHVREYVVGQAGGSPSKIRTKYSIEAPSGSGVGSMLKVIGTTELVRTSPPYAVWRSYEQVLYMRIEAAQKIACPVGFISVPGDSRFGTRDFCIGKYEAKNVAGRVVSQAGGLPYVSHTQAQAAEQAAQSCNGCHLVTEAEWLTVAHNVVNTASNWTNGTVGSGSIYGGHNDGAPANALQADSDDGNGYAGTGQTSGAQRRTLTLSNGEIIWDFSGNVFEWTTGQISTGKPGAGGTWANYDWNSLGDGGSLSPDVFPVFATPAASSWTATHGIGRLRSNPSDTTLVGFTRGGFWSSGGLAGIFSLYLSQSATSPSASVGFRVAVEPLSEVTCSEGFIPVPGNSMFGTSNFCVAKYESKSVSGVARSQAALTPWVSITQSAAITAADASTACSNKCRLINESEWLTIAHNAINVPSNWMGGTIGVNNMYRGHTDSSPGSRQAASADDNDGYFSTGNSGNNQRRTLTLSNGEVIWDFSGNVAEWTSGQVSGGQPGSVASYGWRDWNVITGGTLVPSPFPTFATPAAVGWDYNHDIGRVRSHSSDATTKGFVRGGYWGDGNSAGIFALDLNNNPTVNSTQIGFRMVEVR